MHGRNGQNGATKAMRSVREVVDAVRVQELIDGGLAETHARQKIEESRLMGDHYEDLLAAGYTDEQIGVMWEGKSAQEILAAPNANGTAKRTAPRSPKPQTALNETL